MSDATRSSDHRKRTGLVDALETGSPAAFGIGGLSILLDVILQLLGSVASFTVPGWLNIVLGLGGIWVVLVGLLGFYPLVAEPAPRLSIGGVATGALGWVALTVGLGWAVVLDLTTETTLAEGPPLGTQLFISAIALALLSFLLYGVASTRTESPTRTVGYYLLLPFGAFLTLILLFVGDSVYGIDPPDSVPTLLFGVVALSLIAVSYVLRREIGT